MRAETVRGENAYRNGAVTFLDVLGWKGIWGRHRNAIGALESLVELMRTEAEQRSRGLGSDPKGLTTTVLSISDTIVLLTPAERGDAPRSLDLHGELCRMVLPESLIQGIPLRGATTYGEFLVNEAINIFAGRAIDEAASWYELGDWIGVFMTPSAQAMYRGSHSQAWVEWEVPLNIGESLSTCVVEWSGEFDEDPEAIREGFLNMAPIVPEVHSKFQHTLHFLQAKRPTVSI